MVGRNRGTKVTVFPTRRVVVLTSPCRSWISRRKATQDAAEIGGLASTWNTTHSAISFGVTRLYPRNQRTETGDPGLTGDSRRAYTPIPCQTGPTQAIGNHGPVVSACTDRQRQIAAAYALLIPTQSPVTQLEPMRLVTVTPATGDQILNSSLSSPFCLMAARL